MTFLQPGFLWALLALAIPVLIHLFNFQKTERIIFANTRVLNEVVQQTQKSRQLKNWWLLLLRMLAMSFLILAFAQPQINNPNTPKGSSSLPQATIYVDNSTSMFASKDGKSAFDLGVMTAKTIPTRFNEKGWFQLLTNSFDANHNWTSANGFVDQLTESANPTQTREMQNILQRIDRQLNSQTLGDQKLAFLISDFQKSNVGALEKLKFDSTKKYNLIHVEQTKQANVWVDSVWLPKAISFQNESQQIKVKLSQSGIPFKRKINLQLMVDGNLISGKLCDLGDQNSLEVSLPFRIKSRELKLCTLITDDPEITFDNNFYFKLQAPPPALIYVISEKKNRFLANAFGNKDLFQLIESSYSSIDYKKLKSANLIVLNMPMALENALIEACKNNVAEGKSVFIIAGKVNTELKKSLANEGFQSEENTGIQKPQDWLIKLPSKENAFFGTAFKENSQTNIKPFSTPYLFMKGGLNLLSYENGNPYLSMLTWKDGNLFVCSGPIDSEASSIQQHPLIIPMLFNIVFQSQKAEKNALFGRLSQSTLVIPADTNFKGSESGLNLVKGQSNLKISGVKKGNLITIELPNESLSPGFWKIEENQQTIGHLALNQDKQESEIQFFSEEELKSAFQKKPWISVSSIKENDSPLHSRIGGDEAILIWKYFILTALLMFALEMLVARKRKRTQIQK